MSASEAPGAVAAEPVAPSVAPPAGWRSFPLRPAVAYPLALLSGTLYFLAFPGIDWWPLSFVALVPLIVALRGQPARRGLALGWVAGLTMTMLGFYWLVEMLQIFSGFPIALCVLFMTLLCAYQAGRIALLGWLCARAEQRGWPSWLAFGLAFPASELLFPLLFPWYYGATVHQLPVLLQWAELGGPIAVGMALVALNLAISEVVVALLEQRRPTLHPTIGLAAVPILALVYGMIRIPMVDRAVKKADPVRVVLVQANMSLLGKRLNPDEALSRHLSLTRGAMQEAPVDLVVWSETSIGGAVDERAAESHFRSRIGVQLPVPTIFGAVVRRPVDDARKFTFSNSAMVTTERGDVVGRYDKQFLLAFGEYLPFGDTFPILYEWSPNSGRFTPGETFEPLPVGDRSVATFICYEDIIPSFVNRIMNHGDPQLLVNLTNDAWFGDTTQPWIHMALSKLRAVEQRRFFVRSTNSGVSGFVDPVGRTLATTPTFSEIAVAQNLRWMELGTLYRMVGDVPWWLVAMMSFGIAFIRRPEGRSRARTSMLPPGSMPPQSIPPPGSMPPPRPSAPPRSSPPPTQSQTSPKAITPTVDPSEFGAFPKPPNNESNESNE